MHLFNSSHGPRVPAGRRPPAAVATAHGEPHPTNRIRKAMIRVNSPIASVRAKASSPTG